MFVGVRQEPREQVGGLPGPGLQALTAVFVTAGEETMRKAATLILRQQKQCPRSRQPQRARFF